MKALVLFLLLPLFATSQNGGQFFENNVVKIQYVSNNLTDITFWVISKQTCTANYKVDYGPVELVSIAALDTATFTVSNTTATFKTKCEPQTACISQPDLGWVEIIVATVLPVKLISFNGTQKDGNVTLKWEVVNETVGRFEVQRSIDGRQFTSITTIDKLPGYGNKTYSVIDLITAITYYRLKMFDEYNRPEYSRIITFRGKASFGLKLYGNPVIGDKITFSVNSGKTENIKVSLIDITGRLVLSRSVSIVTGENLIDLQTSLKGIYQLIINTGSGILNEKIIK